MSKSQKTTCRENSAFVHTVGAFDLNNGGKTDKAKKQQQSSLPLDFSTAQWKDFSLTGSELSGLLQPMDCQAVCRILLKGADSYLPYCNVQKASLHKTFREISAGFHTRI